MSSNKCYKISVLDPIFVLHLVHLNRCRFLISGKKEWQIAPGRMKLIDINMLRRPDQTAQPCTIRYLNTTHPGPIRPCKVEPIAIISLKQSKCPDRCINAHKRKKRNDEEQRVRQGQGTKTKEHRHPHHYILPDHHWLLHTPFTEQIEKGVATNLWLVLYPTQKGQQYSCGKHGREIRKLFDLFFTTIEAGVNLKIQIQATLLQNMLDSLHGKVSFENQLDHQRDGKSQ